MITSQSVFDAITADYTAFARDIGIDAFTAIPISGINGDNITSRSDNTPWFEGPVLMDHLEDVPLGSDVAEDEPFRMAVQWVNRPDQHFRGFAGMINQGVVRPGDPVRVLPSGKTSTVARIVSFDGDMDSATRGQSITLTFDDEVDCSRGQIITAAKSPLEVADQFETVMIWMHEDAMIPGRAYDLKIGSQTVAATVAAPKYEINVNTLDEMAAKTLELNAIGIATVTTDRPIPFAAYADNRSLGGFILIDRMTNATVAAGLINFALRRAHNIHWQATDISREHHAKVKNQKPAVLWMTGLSGSGKSTIANAVEKKLASLGHHTFLLDGDNVRHGLNKDLGFTDADRIENIRRIGEVARLMTDAGLIVITAFISPFRAEREMVRQMMAEGEFIEVFVDTPLDVAEERDVKGLYAKARSGQLKNFTGIDSPYEAPENPDIRIDTTSASVEEAAEIIANNLLDRIRD